MTDSMALLALCVVCFLGGVACCLSVIKPWEHSRNVKVLNHYDTQYSGNPVRSTDVEAAAEETMAFFENARQYQGHFGDILFLKGTKSGAGKAIRDYCSAAMNEFPRLYHHHKNMVDTHEAEEFEARVYEKASEHNFLLPDNAFCDVGKIDPDDPDACTPYTKHKLNCCWCRRKAYVLEVEEELDES